MKRIIIHWTAGRYIPNEVDISHYHFLVDGDGKIIKGKYNVFDNENCKDGVYARHTAFGNTGSIGIALCAMFGFVSKNKPGDFPVKQIQLDALFKKCAELCIKYGILPENIFTHYEFNLKHNIKSGKIDIIYLPSYPEIKSNDIGRFIREKIKNYIND